MTGRRLLLANDDVRLPVAAAHRAPSGLYRNATGDEVVYLRTGAARLESSFGIARLPRRRLRGGPHRHHPPLGPDRRDGARRWRRSSSRPAGHVGPPERYLSATGQFLEHSPYCERDLHGPDAPPRRRRIPATTAGRGARPPAGGAHPLPLRPPPVRRGRVGRLPVPVPAVDPRLRADHRPGPPAAAGPPDLRRAPLRRVQLRAPQARLPPRSPCRRPTTTPTSTATRSSSTAPATSRAARAPGIGAGSISLHPGGFTHGPQPGSVEASLGRRVHRRAGGDDRHVRRRWPWASAARACEDPDYAWTWAAAAR